MARAVDRVQAPRSRVRPLKWIRVGVMWVVYPTQRLVYVYESPRQVRILRDADELDGGTVLPGFRIPIVSLFPR